MDLHVLRRRLLLLWLILLGLTLLLLRPSLKLRFLQQGDDSPSQGNAAPLPPRPTPASRLWLLTTPVVLAAVRPLRQCNSRQGLGKLAHGGREGRLRQARR